MTLLTIKQQRIIKWIAYSIQILLIATIIGLSCYIHKQNVIHKNDSSKIKALTTQVDSLTKINSALGAEDLLTVNVNFNLTQKNVLSVAQTNAQNIAKEVAHITRQQLYDSLYVNKPSE